MKLEMSKNIFKGKLITFCGLDGCGKTTQIHKIKDWLEGLGYAVFITKQPTDFVRNTDIFRNYMDTNEHDEFDYRALSLLCASDRIQHTNKVIKKKLEEGCIVISDRYFYSCLANLIARGYEKDIWIYDVARAIVKPDLAFFLDVPIEKAVERVRKRNDEKDRFIDIPLQYRLRQLYLEIAGENNGNVISTMLSEEYCFETIKAEICGILGKKNERK